MYLNHAATTWPKPEIVYETVDRCFRTLNSPDRTTVGEDDVHGAEMMESCRQKVAAFFGIRNPSRLVFVPSATYALNLPIHGLHWHAGDVVIMSGLEHHAVSRPIRKIAREHGVKFEVAPYSIDEPLDLNFVEDRLKSGKVKLLACTAASNVTGHIIPARELGQLADRYGALFLLDASQAAGILPIDVDDLHVDMLGFAGHKGLLGPPGCGGLFVRKGIELETLAEGGTGKDSGQHEMSGRFPSNFEVGTHNLLSILGMSTGIEWIQQTGIDALREHELQLTKAFLDGIREMSFVKLHGPADISNRTAVVSLTFDGITPQDAAKWLAEEHNVATRAGFHCASAVSRDHRHTAR